MKPPPPPPPGSFPASAQDLSLPLVTIKDCKQVVVRFSSFHGQNCMITVKGDNPNFSNLIFHGNHLLLYGYNMNDPAYQNSVLVFTSISGSVTDNVCVRLLDTKPSGESIQLLTAVECIISKRFNILTFPSIGVQNYSSLTPYWFWGSPNLGSNLWFGRRHMKIPKST